MRTFKCPGYKGHLCGKLVRTASNSRKRCTQCAKDKEILRLQEWNASPEGRKRQAAYYASPRVKAMKSLYHASPRGKATFATSVVHKILRDLGLPKTYNLRKLITNRRISNKKLEKMAGGFGWADFPKEAL